MGLRESEVLEDTMTSSEVYFETNRGKGVRAHPEQQCECASVENLSCNGGGVNMKLRGDLYF
jgi:hypothetical protein